ncbi:MAG: 2-C-methyl-D-erythritol 4-phosphate cytidylyltransferase [Lachnospiraceae bacterium]|nr:2-C-methyl-D-erythritol 4-phosphate cytidylyltransferase [Lachnospiraceae bacterium]
MNIAILLSGGKGTRVRSGIPKQFIEVEGHTMIGDCLKTLFAHPLVDAVQVVAEESWHAFIEKQAAIALERRKAPRRKRAEDKGRSPEGRLRGFSAPGETRALSVVNALRDLKNSASPEDIVIIHDAARPFVSADLLTRLIEAAADHDGALPVLPMKDTVYLLPESGEEQLKLLPRERVVAGQAPEAFRYGKYLAANEALFPDKIHEIKGSTEVAVLGGMDIAVIDGEEADYKVTSDADLDRYRGQLRRDV